MEYKELLYLFFGWLLGLIGPSILQKIKNHYLKKEFKKIIIADLRELKNRLAIIPSIVYPKYNKFNLETLEWMMEKTNKIKISETQKEILKKNEDKEILVKLFNEDGIKTRNSPPYLKKNYLFAIDSQLGKLSLIDSSISERLLEIKFQIEASNEDVLFVRELLSRTFTPNLTEENWSLTQIDIENRSLFIADQAVVIVNKIDLLLKDI
jgi:hypothetical protein